MVIRQHYPGNHDSTGRWNLTISQLEINQASLERQAQNGSNYAPCSLESEGFAPGFQTELRSVMVNVAVN